MSLEQDESPNAPRTAPDASSLFRSPRTESSSSPLIAWSIAGVAALGLLVVVLLFNRHKPPQSTNVVLPLDPYAQNLVISIPSNGMSESTSLSGGKSTFIDGHVRNNGSRIVTGATVQVLFSSFDPTQPPQLETVPLTLIRTHEPYVDTQSIASAPLASGDEREFRLIFEDISPNWSQQLPEVHPIAISLK